MQTNITHIIHGILPLKMGHNKRGIYEFAAKSSGLHKELRRGIH